MAKNKPETVDNEIIQPLKVEIDFPSIMDLKQALAFDADGNLLTKIQFTARVDQFETFRLVNLLKQPHGALYAKIGTLQAAMDFHFSPDKDCAMSLKATNVLPQGGEYGGPRAEDIVSSDPEVKEVKTRKKKDQVADVVAERTQEEEPVVKIHSVTFNHIPEDDRPFGVLIEYVNGTGEIRTVAGRGNNPTEAVLTGVKATNALPDFLKEPFEISAALECLDPSPECGKLIKVIESGEFEKLESEKGA